MPPPTNFPTYHQQPEANKAPPGWWAIGSVAAGALAAAMLPAALMGATNWVAALADVMPLWSLCCILGMVTGIKGMSQRRTKHVHRMLAFFGTMLSLVTFIAFVIITVVVAQ